MMVGCFCCGTNFCDNRFEGSGEVEDLAEEQVFLEGSKIEVRF
jgi:hypothetical protein